MLSETGSLTLENKRVSLPIYFGPVPEMFLLTKEYFIMKVKSASAIASKWARVTSGRTEDYEAGVRNPAKDWETETIAAEENYEAGIKASIANKSFSKGVKKAGTEKQKSKTITKGILRWPDGVRDGENDMRDGMEPVVKALEGITLPKRYPTGDPRNIERVKIIQTVLHKLKTG